MEKIEDKKRKKTLLVVDDRVEQRNVIRCLLEHGGFECIEAENGQQAIDIYQSNSQLIDVILMDMKMPIMDGFEATTAIRNWELTNDMPPVPIIAVTAYALLDEKVRVFESGCNIHIAKPFTQNILVQAISKGVESVSSAS